MDVDMIVKKRNEFMADRGKKVMYAHIYSTHPRNGPFNWLPFYKNGQKQSVYRAQTAYESGCVISICSINC